MVKMLNLIIEIKSEYEKKFGSIDFGIDKNWDYSSCIIDMVNKLNIPKYNNIFDCVNVKQMGNLVIFKYKKFEMLFSKNKNISYSDFWNMYDGIFRECRGLVLDIVNDKVVSLPFSKFFNINENDETSENIIRNKLINAKTVEFSNKLDGSLIIVRWYENNLVISSSGVFNSSIINYARKQINDNYLNLIKDYSNYTLMFECIYSEDSHVVVYTSEQNGLYLVGMRNVYTGNLKSYSEVISMAKQYNVKTTEEYAMTFDDILSTKDKYLCSEKEGYVMYIDGLLVKIKCDDYIFLSKASKSNCSKNSIIKAIYNDMIDDLKANVPETYLPIIDETIDLVSKYCRIANAQIDKYLSNAPKEKIEFFKYSSTIPSEFRKYVVNKYLGKKFSVLMEKGNESCPSLMSYSKMKKVIEEYDE